jgi:protein-S-isoprenylcysteine O-methyltransferase Ste14
MGRMRTPTVADVRMQLCDHHEACCGAVLVVVGTVWIGQGTQIIQGSSMTGSTFWAIVGALCVIAGLGLLSWPWRQSPADQ